MRTVLLTPTRDRPKSFALVERAIARQGVDIDAWFVVSDGTRHEVTQGQRFIERTRREVEGHSLCCNLAKAIAAAVDAGFDKPTDRFAVIEDDDYYGPEYLHTVTDALVNGVALAGIAPAHYYHLPSRTYRCMSNRAHASLGMSAFTTQAISYVLACCAGGSPAIDLSLWKNPMLCKQLLPAAASDGKLLHVGFKGCPGTPGIGVGHKPLQNPDPDGAWLIQNIGGAADAWLELA